MEEERGVNELSPALASKLPQGTSEENGQDILKKKSILNILKEVEGKTKTHPK